MSNLSLLSFLHSGNPQEGTNLFGWWVSHGGFPQAELQDEKKRAALEEKRNLEMT